MCATSCEILQSWSTTGGLEAFNRLHDETLVYHLIQRQNLYKLNQKVLKHDKCLGWYLGSGVRASDRVTLGLSWP